MIYGMTETEAPLAAAHDADWSSLEHGPAVRRLLSGLAGGDAAAGSTAIGQLYRLAPDGADVRPWVVAALPVLLGLVADPARPDRERLLRLAGDLAGADRTWQMSGQTLRAKRVLAGYAGLTGLLTDTDPRVREAAAYTVRAVARLTPALPGLLRQRYVDEPDPAVRVTLLCSSVLTGAVGSGYQPTKRWLAWVADSDADLRVRITALTELMALADPPPFDVETARDTVLAAYREGLNREPEPVDDVIAPLRSGQRMAARQWTPGYPQVVSAVRAAYRNDVDAQLDLLERMLDLDARDARHDGLHQALALAQRLRGRYTALVTRAAALLHDTDPQVRAAALRLLHGIGELARPAADAVWAALPRVQRRIRPHDGPVTWIAEGTPGPVLGPAVHLLSALRDERVLPVLHRLLDEAPDTAGLHQRIAGYGVRAHGLSRTLRRRLRALPAGHEAQRAGLLHALTAVAPDEAADHLVREPIDVTTLRLLARAGRAAAGRAPAIRAALTGGDPDLELAAADAIWQVAGDAEAAAAVYDRYFDPRYTGVEHAVAAIDGLGRLGVRVAGRSRHLAARMRGRTDAAVVVAIAGALWRITADRNAARTLGPVWESAPRLRPRIARLWVETGDARYAGRYARAELGTALRHNGGRHGLPAPEIDRDERLLARCRELLAQAG
ncbi:hypothetical protein FHX34_106269 [Actinoplanes teichomyceticus]|uniref:HEAT repeat protein n=2 Tax=Actinoplanes teichomyceticus TaxID=1867 RepID=A0A561VIW1_ACTTI|nr:hypothetical protein FHX34_106269 [Actinoplanes teichomyceticus]